MRKFYDLPKAAQWVIAIILLTGGLATLMPVLAKPYGLLILPLLAPFLNLISVPFLRLIGYYKYLNPFVLSTVQNNAKYDLHNIFTFDYLVNFKWADRGKTAQRILLGHYFKALLSIIERIESKKIPPTVKVVGHSYFFNNRTAKKLGFTVSKAPIFWVINSALQFIELTYLYSFSKGKWAIPEFWKVKKAEITGTDLVAKKQHIEGLMTKLLQA